MGAKRVYVVHYSGDDYRLTASVDGKTVPMDEFVQTHVPIQVTSLTQLNREGRAQNFVGLILAEETPAPD